MLVESDFTGTHIAKVCAWYQKCAPHLVRCISRKKGELDIEVVFAKINHRVLMSIWAIHLFRSHEMSSVVIIEGTGPN